MAKPIFSLTNFIAQARVNGFAKNNRFEVEIAPPPGLTFYTNQDARKLAITNVEIANFPVLNILNKQLRAQGPAYQRPVGMEFGGEGINITFVLDQSMKLKAFFDAWMFKIVNPYSSEVSYKDKYIGESIKIKQLNNIDDIVYSVILTDVFPRSMSLLDLSQSNQNQYHKLTVTFAYRKWISEHESFGSLDVSPTTLVPTMPKIVPPRPSTPGIFNPKVTDDISKIFSSPQSTIDWAKSKILPNYVTKTDE